VHTAHISTENSAPKTMQTTLGLSQIYAGPKKLRLGSLYSSKRCKVWS